MNPIEQLFELVASVWLNQPPDSFADLARKLAPEALNNTLAETKAQLATSLSAADIAGKFGVSPHHLAKVLRQLTRAGIVESSRGVGGGNSASRA